jgi:hypothetical protein
MDPSAHAGTVFNPVDPSDPVILSKIQSTWQTVPGGKSPPAVAAIAQPFRIAGDGSLFFAPASPLSVIPRPNRALCESGTSFAPCDYQ